MPRHKHSSLLYFAVSHEAKTFYDVQTRLYKTLDSTGITATKPFSSLTFQTYKLECLAQARLLRLVRYLQVRPWFPDRPKTLEHFSETLHLEQSTPYVTWTNNLAWEKHTSFFDTLILLAALSNVCEWAKIYPSGASYWILPYSYLHFQTL